MKLKNLFEEFSKMKKFAGNSYSIHINPDKKEIEELKKEGERFNTLRYIVRLYGKPVIYVFNSELLHYKAAEELGIEYKDRVHRPVWGDYGFGISKFINGKFDLDERIKKEVKQMGKRAPLEFLRKYFRNI